jgi:outer membrane protein assembly factor BamB
MKWSALLLIAIPLMAAQPILQQLWTTPTYPLIPLSLALAPSGSLAFVGATVSGPGSVYLFSSTGAMLTSVTYISGMRGVAYGNYFVVADGSQILVLSKNGLIVKVIDSKPQYVSQVAVDPKEGIIVACNVDCAAYSIKTGKELWETKISGAVLDSPVIANGKIYVPDSLSMTLYIMNEKDGKIIKSIRFKSPVIGVSYCKGMLAVLTPKELYALNPTSLKPLWSVKFNNYVHGVAVSPTCKYVAVGGSRLYFVSNNGKVVTNVSLGAPIAKLRWNGNYLAVLFNANGNSYVQLFKVSEAVMTSYGTPKTRYVLNFSLLKGASRASALTYPSPKGTVFLVVWTTNGTQEIWTLSGGKVVGKFKVPKSARLVYDTRMGEYGTYHDMLLIAINDTVYGLYGSKLTPIAKLKGAHSLLMVKVKNDIYAVDVYSKQKNNSTIVECKLYNVLKGMKKVESYEFDLGKGKIRFNVLPDLLDAQGCLVVWQRSRDLNIYYWYKGVNGEFRGAVNPLKSHLLTLAMPYLEVAKGESYPFIITVSFGPSPKEPFILNVSNPLAHTKFQVALPGPYSVIGTGDYTGEGYLGDLALISGNSNNVTMVIISSDGRAKYMPIGRIEESSAVLMGIAYHKGFTKNVFGLGNFTGAYVDVKTNIGTLKFEVRGLTVAPSNLGIVIGLSKTQMCYTAIINPFTTNVMTGQIMRITGSQVYVASGCAPR